MQIQICTYSESTLNLFKEANNKYLQINTFFVDKILSKTIWNLQAYKTETSGY